MYIQVNFQSLTKENSSHKHIEGNWLHICPFCYPSQVIYHLRQAIATQAKEDAVCQIIVHVLPFLHKTALLILCLTYGEKSNTNKSARPFPTTPYQYNNTYTNIHSKMTCLGKSAKKPPLSEEYGRTSLGQQWGYESRVETGLSASL